MKYKAVQKYVRMTPRKLRLVADMVRELTPAQAAEMLPYVRKRAAKPLGKTIRSAIANAKQQGVSEEKLVFEEIQIGEGPRLKRGRPVARGAMHPVLKRWSHIRIVLSDEAKPEKKVETAKREPRTKVRKARMVQSKGKEKKK